MFQKCHNSKSSSLDNVRNFHIPLTDITSKKTTKKCHSSEITIPPFISSPDGESLAWDSLVDGITRTDKLREMVREGIPHSLRAHIWLRLAGAHTKRAESDVSYKEIVRASSNDHLMTSRQIEKDLLRTMPTNACFNSPKATGVPRLRRVLRGIAWLYPDIGYCQVRIKKIEIVSSN